MADMIIRNMSFKEGQTMTITGITKLNYTDFQVNICPNVDDIALHVNPRFKEEVVVYNSYKNGHWHEEFRHGNVPYKQGGEFKMVIEFIPNWFVVNLTETTTFKFPNKLGAEKYSVFSFKGGVRVQSIEIK